MSGRRSRMTEERKLEIVSIIRQQRKLIPPGCINRLKIIEHFDGEFGDGVAQMIVKLVNGKEVAPPKTKFGYTKSKTFMKSKKRDVDYSLEGVNPFSSPWTELVKEVENTKVVYSLP